jgi:hypothetical protein
MRSLNLAFYGLHAIKPGREKAILGPEEAAKEKRIANPLWTVFQRSACGKVRSNLTSNLHHFFTLNKSAYPEASSGRRVELSERICLRVTAELAVRYRHPDWLSELF